MKELPKAYIPKDYEDQIYSTWEKSGVFKPDEQSEKDPFVITMPPPNATGTLHLGHAVMLAVEDIMIRYHRMNGHPTLWIPGTDHAAIATQNRVEKDLLQNQGLTRMDLGREKFLERVKSFVAESQSIIRSQVKKMGSSCDWSREAYTMDDALNRTVNETFKRMYSGGLIYRGDRVVNWCTRCKSTLSDDEVSHKETTANLYTFKYDNSFPFEIATTRPETKLGDTAVAVNPKDKRYQHLVGKIIEANFLGQNLKLAIIADESIDPEFGMGALGVTPNHSIVDDQLAQKHGLERKQVIDEDGQIAFNYGKYSGMKVMDARKEVVKDLQDSGLISEIKEISQNLSVCYRCGTTIEPLVSKQWFIDVNHHVSTWDYESLNLKKGTDYSLKEVMQHVLRDQQIEIIPDRFGKTYFQWIDNLRDWCISRQIWWGHQIPVWYCVDCNKSHGLYLSKKDRTWSNDGINRVSGAPAKIVMNGIDIKDSQYGELDQYELKVIDADIFEVSEQKPKKCKSCGSSRFLRDPDTLDTWFSSGLWTFSTLGWIDGKEDFKKFHPTSVLETGYDILFFWVARMILMTTYMTGQVPFKKVYLHGLVRDRNGKKMSKSNPETCIDPLDMISEFGADALRLSLFVGSSPGNDMRLYKEKIEGYRNFVNKLWNVARYILLTAEGVDDMKKNKIENSPKPHTLADEWILDRLQSAILKTSKSVFEYKFSQAVEDLYAFTWSDLADWYLEISKVQKREKGSKLSKNTDQILLYVLKNLLKLWHPFTPFVTEELWKNIKDNEMLISEKWPNIESTLSNKKAENDFEKLRQLITGIRNVRTEQKVEPSKKISITLVSDKYQKELDANAEVIKALARLDSLTIKSEKSGGSTIGYLYATIADIHTVFHINGMIDAEKELQRLKKEIINLDGYIKGLKSKLKNKKFVQNAKPEIVAAEREKLGKSEESVKKIKEQLKALK